ncbi:MAG: glycosyltransferase family 4 protein, partial [Ignavibacteriales bacterium]|nr:glycosyltransferase family 4 protein [Ignavibacteriales bacterium]
VVAFAQGGALETVVEEGDHRTGIFFYEQTVPALTDAITSLGRLQLNSQAIRTHSEQFDRAKFKEKLSGYITGKLNQHRKD